jgi:hypothetical protein
MKVSKTCAVAALVLGLGAQGCDILGGGLDFVEPLIGFKGASLSRAPGLDTVAAYYCPDLLGGVSTLCTLALGPRPGLADMNFYFDLDFDAGNSGPIPIPVAEMLVGLNLFQGSGQQALGDTCVTFCEAGAPDCDGAPSSPNACRGGEDSLGDGWDVANAAKNLLFAAAEDGPNGVAENLRVRVIPPGKDINLRMTFGISPLQLLSSMTELGKQAATNLASGKGFKLDIPYEVRGALFYDVPSFGRFDAPFGPTSSTWSIQ